MPRIINTHSHVNTLKNIPVETAIQNLKREDIIAIVPSSSARDIFEISDFIKKYDCLYGYTGIFPEEVKSFTASTLNDMENLIKENPKIIGIGEVGLDYYWDTSFKDLQKDVFIKQIDFANQMNLPLNIHCREAYGDTLQILDKYNKNSTAIMHCFSGSFEFAKECIKRGMYLSFGGVVTFKNAIKVKEVVKNIPLENLLLETDDPYLTPVPYRGTENQPCYVTYVAQEVSKLRNISFEETIKAATANAQRIFPILNTTI